MIVLTKRLPAVLELDRTERSVWPENRNWYIDLPSKLGGHQRSFSIRPLELDSSETPQTLCYTVISHRGTCLARWTAPSVGAVSLAPLLRTSRSCRDYFELRAFAPKERIFIRKSPKELLCFTNDIAKVLFHATLPSLGVLPCLTISERYPLMRPGAFHRARSKIALHCDCKCLHIAMIDKDIKMTGWHRKKSDFLSLESTSNHIFGTGTTLSKILPCRELEFWP
jgi:hypothetical protein